jgi:hypothetical protein
LALEDGTAAEQDYEEEEEEGVSLRSKLLTFIKVSV